MHANKALILGVALLITGLGIICVLLLFPQVETVSETEIDMTTRNSYFSPSFRAEEGYWLDLDIHSTGNSTLYVRGHTKGEIFQVSGTTFEYKVSITPGDIYRIEVANNDEGHWSPLHVWIDPIEINITGSFCLRRKPLYYHLLMSFGAIMLAVGLLISMHMEHKARQEAWNTNTNIVVHLRSSILQYLYYGL